MKKILIYTLVWLPLFTCQSEKSKADTQSEASVIRFASYNVALYRKELGDLARDLAEGRDTQIQNIAAAIQYIRPDVIALMEFDYNADGALLEAFQKNYLSVGQQQQQPIDYPFKISIPSNTGVLSPHDYNNDGKNALPEDAYGFGRYEGQYAFALLSRFPIDEKSIRTFQKLKWASLPDAKKPVNEDGTPYYTDDEWEAFRLSSKNHVDIPVNLPDGKPVHIILAHPTPPVFDGPEDRNGLRNFDEIRLLRDYIMNADYLLDDNGKKGGLAQNAPFVIMGDLNADPLDGDSYPGAISQLLDCERIQKVCALGSKVPASKGGKAHNRSENDKGDPAFDTSFFGKRIDYVLPSKEFQVLDSGVLWPVKGEPLYEQIKDKRASDHLMVWVDTKY